MDLEECFLQRLLDDCSKSRELGYYPTRFEQMLASYGGKETAKKLVKSGEAQYGLEKLARLNHLDLSMEHAMLDEKFRSLFTKSELEAAQWHLDQVSSP